MSKWINELPDGTYKEEIANKNECKYMYNEVCCNDKSDWCADYPDAEIDCKKCELFEPED